jgi:glycosyltransferase involved in cell wall biosynthesis
MKVVHVIPSLKRAGAELMATQIASNLHERGHDVLLVTLSPESEIPIRIPHTVVPKDYKFGLISGLRQHSASLNSVFNDFKPDLIHTHLYEAEFAVKASRYMRAKHITHFHDKMHQFSSPIEMGFKYSLSTRREIGFLKKMYSMLDNRFVAISKDVYKYINSVLPNFGKVYLLPNATELTSFHQIKREPSAIPRIAMTGSLTKNKNQSLLLHSCKLLNEYTDFELHLFGDGPDRDMLESLALELGISSKVHFHGVVNDLPKHYEYCNIYVHVSLSESFGLAILEAMAAGLPVVALRAGGNEELIENGITGLLVDRPDAVLICSSIISAFSQSSALGESGRGASEKYCMGDYVDGIEKMYYDV